MLDIHTKRNLLGAAALAALLALTGVPAANAESADARSAEIWESLKPDVFGERAIQTNTGLVSIEAPARAEDAAIVPVDIKIDPVKAGGAVKSLTLIVDVNPAPVAATFQFGREAGVTKVSTRLRVNDYSYIRAIAETASGELHMAETFVKASGGCSAPALKNQDEALASMGLMKLRKFAPDNAAEMSSAHELQLMIRHPNNSGLQMDQVTRHFIPAHFVHKLTVAQGDDMILSMEGGISISEDPNFRFDYKPNDAAEISVEAQDTEGKTFTQSWPADAIGL
jgi:sulfur-oxidizing protein SoxY